MMTAYFVEFAERTFNVLARMIDPEHAPLYIREPRRFAAIRAFVEVSAQRTIDDNYGKGVPISHRAPPAARRRVGRLPSAR
jgi:hypothetical protein